MKNIAILGSTGSIGTQTLDIVDQNKEDLQVVALRLAAILLYWKSRRESIGRLWLRSGTRRVPKN